MRGISVWSLEKRAVTREGFLIGKTGHLDNLVKKETIERVEV